MKKRFYEKILKAKLKTVPRGTKSQELRAEIVQREMLKKKKESVKIQVEEKKRKQKLREIGKAIEQEVLQMDRQRKEDYPGQFVVSLIRGFESWTMETIHCSPRCDVT